ncbi:MAG: M28 family peptidase [Bacteroidota bacterium]|jgi:Zn-dependent M28 family amino/carboxypeptidase
MTDYKAIISQMDFKSTATRRQIVLDFLNANLVPYELHHYETGTNVIVKLGNPNADSYAAVSSHLDRYNRAGGANDNGAALATCLEFIVQYIKRPLQKSVLVFFFDEEETGLRGSTAYAKAFGVMHIDSMINMELVGTGRYGILWPVISNPNAITQKLINISSTISNKKDSSQPNQSNILLNDSILPMPEFPLQFSDADAFKKAGLRNAITFTRITKNDYESAKSYLEAFDSGTTEEALFEFMDKSETLKTYHRPSDTAFGIDPECIYANVTLINLALNEV